ncbi:MAG: tetratricopeptide repeat protein [Candidatus Gastranaerophilales bacterium]|nr:tetratricopeptide repeat protein [Candidatus Gastranaerophilales bacterium]
MKQKILREYYQIIKSKISQSHFETAMINIDKLLYNFPKDEHGYYYKGVCEFATNNHKNAIKYYNAAIKINPAYAKAYFNLGVVYYIYRQYDLALINIGKALVIFSKQKELDKKQRCIDALKLIEKERGAI